VKHDVLHFAVTKTSGMGLFVLKFEISFGALLDTIIYHHISMNFMRKFMETGTEVTRRAILWVLLHKKS
jgi:hypothetical protein